jgi:hypothetical protein
MQTCADHAAHRFLQLVVVIDRLLRSSAAWSLASSSSIISAQIGAAIVSSLGQTAQAATQAVFQQQVILVHDQRDR